MLTVCNFDKSTFTLQAINLFIYGEFFYVIDYKIEVT